MEKREKKQEISLEEITEKIISQLQKEYPMAKFLINSETYGEEDIDIDIFAFPEDLLKLDRFANEVTYKAWEETGYNILPMIAPIEYCPIK